MSFVTRWFWHFYAISAGWNSILLFFYTKTIIYHQTYPTWLTGILGILTGAPSNHSRGRSSVPFCLKCWVCLIDSNIPLVCSPAAVNFTGAAAALHSFPQEAAGVSVCQCLLQWSYTFGTVYIWFVLLHHNWVDCALHRPPWERSIYKKKLTFLLIICCFCCVIWTFLIFFLGTENLPSQLEWFHVAGCVLFIGASFLQHHSMILLAKLRTGQSGELL